MESQCLNDHSFGPNVRGCRDDFDFTLGFERVFFAILPGSVFIASCLLRLAYLFPRPRIVNGVGLQCAKLVRRPRLFHMPIKANCNSLPGRDRCLCGSTTLRCPPSHNNPK